MLFGLREVLSGPRTHLDLWITPSQLKKGFSRSFLLIRHALRAPPYPWSKTTPPTGTQEPTMPSNTTNLTILLGATLASALTSSAIAGGDGDLLFLRLTAKATSEVHGSVYNLVTGDYQEFNDSYIVDSDQNLADYLAFEAIETRSYEGAVDLLDGSRAWGETDIRIDEYDVPHVQGFWILGHNSGGLDLGPTTAGYFSAESYVEVVFKLYQPTIVDYHTTAQTHSSQIQGTLAEVWIWDHQTAEFVDNNVNIDDNGVPPNCEDSCCNCGDYQRNEAVVLLQPGYYTFAGRSVVNKEWSAGAFEIGTSANNNSSIHFNEWIPGDINLDGEVDGADLALILAAWGGNDEMADLNGDGIVNGADMALVLANWT